ncbi:MULTISPECIES: hypothetical protein [unclassified Arcicella]|uniref:hypothetical protein n=1 Tax=unclassified Arcicella TaxID=2644986 RepID=UPI002855BCAF|nr:MULTISPECIES: hypothetical protein [unclassified Arcicella]MDR6561438.1 hypothetical protein [Arcicella sp. BE51]MDR6811322.1 hypothetical protein [Arcicella sp. BE140]MDR6822672.1 hypothetical protein [Arcicella sp. BE139]
MMKVVITFFPIFFLYSCTFSSNEKHKDDDNLSAQKFDSYNKFNNDVSKRLKEIKTDSVLKANLQNKESVYILSILPAREEGFWIIVSPSRQEITSNFKRMNLGIQRKDYNKISLLIAKQTKIKNIDSSFCFECYADPTVFILEDINAGHSKRTINLINDWQSILF